jgi:hypothetical protein
LAVINVLLQLLLNSLEHDIHEVDENADERSLIASEKTSNTNTPATIWNAKVLFSLQFKYKF